MRRFVFVFLAVFWGAALAQPTPEKLPDVIRSLAKAGTDPIVAESTHATEKQKTIAAIVQLTSNTAAIVVAVEVKAGLFELVARSKPFALSRESNFGGWVEDFRLVGQDRLELGITSRHGCARKATTHRFSLRGGTWLVSGLDSTVLRCTDNGVVEDFSETTNYLNGKSIRTVFAQAKAPRTVRLTSPRKAFPLSEFPPDGPEVAYSELQH